MKPIWDEVDERFKWMASDNLGYTLWSHKPYKISTSAGDRWQCDDCSSFGNIPDYDANRAITLERRP